MDMRPIITLLLLFVSIHTFSQKKDTTVLYNQFRDYVDWLHKREKDLVFGDDNEKYQMVYYERYIIDKKRHKIYLYTSYDLAWGDESGLGWQIIILNRKRQKK